MTDLTRELRRLQRAANMLSLADFCKALGLEVDDYARDKYVSFGHLGEIHRFSDSTLEKLVEYYEQGLPPALSG